MGIHFNPEINLGNLVALAGFLIALYRFHMSAIERMNKMHMDNVKILTEINTKLTIIWDWFTEHKINNRDN